LRVSIYISKGFQCTNCKSKIYNFSNAQTKCPCGALYSAEVKQSNGEFECDMKPVGFVCIERECNNICHTAWTFCRDHCGDETIKSVENSIKYSEQTIEELEEKLKRITDSRKTWAVLDLSGLSE